MSNLNLQTVELTTSISTAPLNGPTSSRDFNEQQRSVLIDLASLSDFINSYLIPMFSALQSTAVSSGLTSTVLVSDPSDQTDAFYDSVAQQPLVVADSIRLLRALIRQLQTKMVNIGVEIAALESKTSSNSQADLSAAVASLVNQLASLTATVSAIALEVNGLQTSLGAFGGNITPTGSIPAGATQQITVNLVTPYVDNNYIATVALEEGTGNLQILSFTYQLGGLGLFVLVRNNSSTSAASGNVHTITRRF